MTFEEALKEMRLGKRITHPSFDKDTYFQACYVSIGAESIDEAKERGMSIVKMKGDKQHPDMRPSFEESIDPCKHGTTPQISIFLLMVNNWEIYCPIITEKSE